MLKGVRTLSLTVCLVSGMMIYAAEPGVNPANSSASRPHLPQPLTADNRSCCRKVWEWLTFRLPPTSRNCLDCPPYPLKTCTPPLYQYFQNRYPEPNSQK